MTFTSDERISAYREAVNARAQGAELVVAETGLTEYMVEHTNPALRGVTLRVLVREGISREAIIAGAGLTEAEAAELPPADTVEHDPVGALRAMPYLEYLKTDYWHFTRRAAIERAHGRCNVCNSTEGLEVHHRTYENRGEERPEDLIVLCAACHGLFHEHGKLAA